MKKTLFTIASLSLLLLISGCGSKKYFEPESVDGTYQPKSISTGGKIIDFNKVGGTLSNNMFITKDGLVSNKVGKEFFFLNKIDENTISADNNGNLAINDTIIQMDNIVIAATKSKNLLALLYIDNSIAVYDLDSKQTIFKEALGESLANDTKVTNPVFMSDLILFPSLNGKVIVYSITNGTILREIIVDATNKQFKNITFFEVVDEQLIAATANSILSIGATLHAQNYEIKDVATKDDKIYLATIDGQIIVMDKKLTTLNSSKFKFAKIYGIGFGADFVYALEYGGYIIKMDKDLNNQSILKLSFDNESRFISTGSKLYFDNKYIELD